MRGNAHVRFGGRTGETERSKGRHRASVRPYYVKAHEAGRVVSIAALVATGVAASGERRVLGLELSPGHDEGSAWPAFIRSLVERGLRGVRLVKAVHEQLLGSSWQRCRVHCTRNAQDLVPRSARSMIASAIRLVFEQPDEVSARAQLDRVIDTFAPALPRGRPAAHRCRARSPGPLRVPGAAPPPDPLDQPPGAAQQGDQAPDRRGRDLPHPRLGHPPRRDDPRRAGRRVAGREALLQARDDGTHRCPSTRGGGTCPANGELIKSGREDEALLHQYWDLTRLRARELQSGTPTHRQRFAQHRPAQHRHSATTPAKPWSCPRARYVRPWRGSAGQPRPFQAQVVTR